MTEQNSSTELPSSSESSTLSIKLQLANATQVKLEKRLEDSTSLFEAETLKSTNLETKYGDAIRHIERLKNECELLRASNQTMHLNALETLDSIERAEYERRKSSLIDEYEDQLHSFQQQEEESFRRQKARIRVKSERHLEDDLNNLRWEHLEQVEATTSANSLGLRKIREEHQKSMKELRSKFDAILHRRQVEYEKLYEEKFQSYKRTTNANFERSRSNDFDKLEVEKLEHISKIATIAPLPVDDDPVDRISSIKTCPKQETSSLKKLKLWKSELHLQEKMLSSAYETIKKHKAHLKITTREVLQAKAEWQINAASASHLKQGSDFIYQMKKSLDEV